MLPFLDCYKGQNMLRALSQNWLQGHELTVSVMLMLMGLRTGLQDLWVLTEHLC